MRKYIKGGISLLLMCFTFCFITNVEAKTLGELKKELSDAEAKYSTNEEDKKKTETEISQTKEKINSINKEKEGITDDIDALNSELEDISVKIKGMESEIKKIINYYQLSSSSNPYLEYVFKASDYTDFIYRMAVSEQLTKYRENKINEYNSLTEQNRTKLNELSEKQTSLDTLEGELSVELTNLGSELASISEASIDIEDEINNLKSSVSLYESKYGCSDDEQISTCVDRYNEAARKAEEERRAAEEAKKAEEARQAEEEARRKAQENQASEDNSSSETTSNTTSSNSTTTITSTKDFYRPVTAGRVNANYGYSSYYGSTFHYGMDIGVSHGTPVYSIADGTVVARWDRYKCGGNMVWVAHIINGKRYTSAYYHLASINVSVGDYVTKDTVVGYSGGVPSIETWDGCSTGAHVHLQMASGLYMTDYFWYSDFQARSMNPRTIIDFPSAGSSFSGR